MSSNLPILYKYECNFHHRSVEMTGKCGTFIAPAHDMHKELSVSSVMYVMQCIRMKLRGLAIPNTLRIANAHLCFTQNGVNKYMNGETSMMTFTIKDDRAMKYALWYYYDTLHAKLADTIGNIAYYHQSYPDRWNVGTTDDGLIGEVLALIRDTKEKPIEIVNLGSNMDYIKNVVSIIQHKA